MAKPICKRCGREKGSEICIARCGKPEGGKPAEADDTHQLHLVAHASMTPPPPKMDCQDCLNHGMACPTHAPVITVGNSTYKVERWLKAVIP